VSTTTKQAKEATRLTELAEPCVWTERMLTCLSEDGPKGGQWFSLIDKVWALPTLERAWAKVKANRGAAGVDGESIRQFARHAASHLGKLQRQLQQGTYRPLPVRRVWIEKPGKRELRPLGIPAVRDRIVQTALRLVLEPIFEHEFAPCSYGFRPGRGCLNALRRVEEELAAGQVHVVDADLQGYFDSIPHDRLMAEVEKRIADGQVLALLRAYLRAEVLDGLDRWTPGSGTPQGAVISPLLANLYLNELDWRLLAAGYAMVRYADDFVLLCPSQADAAAALALVERFCQERGLTLHPEKTRLVDAREKGGFDFLGYHFERGYRWPTAKAMKRLRQKLKKHTPRKNGKSLPAIIAKLNPILRGWFGYFKYTLRNVHREIDGYLRGRLRNMLRKRSHRRGRACGLDHQRWPNATFHAAGLFCLEHAHQEFCQSLQAETH
jgi:RNA-directed DNA polymerase